MAEENNLEKKWMEDNYIEHLQAAARELKTWCKSHQDSSRYCLTCCFWGDTEGCSIYNWPEYWEV